MKIKYSTRLQADYPRIWVFLLLMCPVPGLFAQQYNLRTYTAADGLDPYVAGLTSDSLGYLYVATRTGSFRFDGFRFAALADSLIPAFPAAVRPAPDSLRAWNFPLRDAEITAMLRTRAGRTWIGTRNAGAFAYLPTAGRWLRLDESTGLGRNHVRALHEDRWGFVWIGTQGGGLSRYAGRQFVQYGLEEGLRRRMVYDLARDSSGGRWLAMGRAGISRFYQNTLRHYGPREGYPLRDARTLLVDPADRLWIGTRGTGLYLFDSLGFHGIELGDSLALLDVRALARDRLGNIWLATAAQGVLQISPPDTSYRVTARKRYGRAEGLPAAAVNALHVDRHARVWMGTDAGLVVLEGTRLRPVDALGDAPITGIGEDATGRLWVSARTGLWSTALYTAIGYTWTVARDERLPDRNLRTVAVDSLGMVWTADQTALYRARPNAAGGFARVQRYTAAEGFRGGEVLPGALLPEAGGALWLGTTNGLTYYRPGTDRRNTVPPVVDLRDIRLFYESMANTLYRPWLTASNGLRPGLELPPDENHLGFEFFAVNLPDPDGLRYQWRLDGAEAAWSPLTDRRDAMYPNLPPGDYTFRVRACNEDGHCGAPVAVPFGIRAPWHQRWWVRAAALGFFLLLLWGLFYLRLRQIRRRNARAQERLRLQNQLLELESKARRLQMNPHFIFNALHTVQGLIAQGDTGKARRQLTRFSKLMRAILEQSIHEKISLADELATLESYLAVEHTSRSESFTYAVTSELEEDPESIYLPPMLVQPFVENALQHGISARADGEVRIRAVQRGDRLRLTVTDNGIGRVAAAQKHYKDSKSRALEVTRERLRLLGAGAALRIVDLTHADGSAAGTRVELELPIG